MPNSIKNLTPPPRQVVQPSSSWLGLATPGQYWLRSLKHSQHPEAGLAVVVVAHKDVNLSSARAHAAAFSSLLAEMSYSI